MLVDALRADAARHEQGNFSELGRDFEPVEQYRSQHPDTGDENTGIALTFWDSWIDQVRHGFEQNFYSGIAPGSWPGIAREIADNLESGTPVTNGSALQHFDLTRG